MEIVDASYNDQLGLAEDGKPSKGRVGTVSRAVSEALDAYLHAAQRGKPTLVPLGAQWLDEFEPVVAKRMKTEVTNRDNPVVAARYDLTVHVEPNPTLVVAEVRVERHDGTPALLDMVFDVTTPKQPRLQLVTTRKDGS